MALSQSVPYKARVRAVRYLGRMGDARAVPTVLKVLGDEMHMLRYAGLLVLAELRTPEALATLVRYLENERFASLAEHRLRDVAGESFGTCRHPLTPEKLLAVQRWREWLKETGRRGNNGVQRAIQIRTAYPPQTVSLNLSGTAIGNTDLAELRGLTKLVHLNLARTRVSDAGLGELAGLHALSTLDISSTKVTDDGLRQLTEIRRLTALTLSNTLVTDRGLEHVARMRHLRSLDLYNCQAASGKGLGQLRSLQELACLDLSHTAANDETTRHLSGLRRIRELYLFGDQITDRGLESLATMASLRTLGLWGCTRLTEQGMRQLKRLPLLTTLYLPEHLRESAFPALQKAGPSALILR